MRPVLFDLPWIGWPIHSYGLMIALGFLAAIYIAMWRARKVGILPRHIMNCGLLALLGGVAGARIGFLIENWRSFEHASFWHIVNLREGGLTVTGGVPLAMGLIILYLLVRRIKVHRFLDVIAPAVAIGLVFGRIGCFLNGCCYGQPADVPWAIQFPAGSPAYMKQIEKHELPHEVPPLLQREDSAPGHVDAVDYRDLRGQAERIAAAVGAARDGKPLPAVWAGVEFLKPYYAPDGAKRGLSTGAVADEVDAHLQAMAWTRQYMCAPVHPTQVYQMLTGLALFGLLTLHWRFRRHEGQVAAAFTVLYATQRLTVEFFRDTSNPVALHMNPFQWYMAGAVVAGIAWYVLVSRLTRPLDPAEIAADLAKMQAEQDAQHEAAARKREKKADRRGAPPAARNRRPRKR